MPKIRTHSASKKRFRVTGTGKIKMKHAFSRHRLISKSAKAKRSHRNTSIATSANEAAIKKLLPYK